jgi:acetyltransferase-like isoleucine patch superfamily enzyme
VSKARKHNLRERYGDETPLQRYIRLTVGEKAGLWSLILHEMSLGICTGMPGILGIGLRMWIYSLQFKGFNRKVFLGRHVTLRCPRQITFSTNVVIDDFVQLIATSSRPDAIRIGSGSFIRSYALLNSGPPDGYIHIGEECSIGQGAILYGNGGIEIGNQVMIAGQCFLVASSHNTNDPSVPMIHQGFTAKGIKINDNVWIGAGAKILDGVTIGERAVIGANAVVNRSVPPGGRVGGVPAKRLTTAAN